MNVSIDKGKMKGGEGSRGASNRRVGLCVAGILGPCQMSLVRQTLRTSRILFDTRERGEERERERVRERDKWTRSVER